MTPPPPRRTSSGRRKGSGSASGPPPENLPEEGSPIEPVWLVTGTATLLVKQAVTRIADAALAGSPASFNRAEGSASDGEVQAMLGQARTPPMMGARRVVVIRELEGAKVADLEKMADYAKDPAPTTVLLLCGRSLPSNKGERKVSNALTRAVKKTGRVIRYPDREQDPVAFVQRRARGVDVVLPPDVARFLVEVVGSDLGILASEVDKAITYAGDGGTVTRETVEEVCCLLAEAVVWELTDAIVQGNAARAMAILHRKLAEGEEPQLILGLVSWKLRQLVQLQACDREGRDLRSAGVKLFGRSLGQARSALRRRTIRADRVLDTLARANQQMRGHRAGSRHVLEALVLGLVKASD